MPKLLDDVNGALERLRRLGVQGSDQLPDQLTDEEKQQTADAVERLDVEIYTGADDRILRRMVVDLGLQARGPARRARQALDVGFDLQLLDVNEDQEIEAPSGAKPFDELVAQLEGLGLGPRPRRRRQRRRGGGGADQQNLDATPSASRRPRGDSAEVRKCADLLTTP